MTLLEKLQTHRGGLLHIKSQLYWYDGGGWDGVPDRICLVLDAADPDRDAAAAGIRAAGVLGTIPDAGALVLIDGQPRWIWVDEKDVELLDGGDQ